MKPDIHPICNEIKVTCSCGNTFVTHSTIGKDLSLEVCSNCHPFYTGQQKIVDAAGRVDRFRQKYGMGKHKDTADKKADKQADKKEVDHKADKKADHKEVDHKEVDHKADHKEVDHKAGKKKVTKP